MAEVKKILDRVHGSMHLNHVTSQQAKPQRLYKVWPGNNKFLCGGRIVLGPDARSLMLTTFLIGGPAFTFCLRMLIRIKEHDPLYGYGVLCVGLILTLLDLTFLYLTSGRDPGIILRNTGPETEEEFDPNTASMEWVASKASNTRIPRTKDVMVDGYKVKVKFCDTCRLYRPPRASHCSICNNCVQKFDHHCPWVGQCIGLRNYRTFILFISSSTFLCIYVFTFSLINILREGSHIWRTVSGDLVSVILVVYCFIAVWFVGGLTVFHFYLVTTNQTTYENFRNHYDRDKNPHNRGVLKNLLQIFCTKPPPSAVNFRELVLVEDVPATQSFHEGFIGFRKNFDIETGHKINKDGTLVIPGVLPNSEYVGDKDKVKKNVGDQNTSFDLIILPSDQKESRKAEREANMTANGDFTLE